jgi:peroxiredoxin
MGKHRKWTQRIILLVLLIIAFYTVASSLLQERTTIPDVGDPVPSFSLETLAGEITSSSIFQGKPHIINFWGTFCPPCVEETPALQRLHQKYKQQGLIIVGINLGEKPVVRVEQFIQRFQLTYPILLDPELRVRDQFGVTSYPTTFFVESSGIIKEIKIGGMTEGYIESQILKLLK